MEITNIIVVDNPLGLAWWCWLGTLECAPLKVSGSSLPGANFGGLVWLIKKYHRQGLRFKSPWCKFPWVSLAYKKKIIVVDNTNPQFCLFTFYRLITLFLFYFYKKIVDIFYCCLWILCFELCGYKSTGYSCQAKNKFS